MLSQTLTEAGKLAAMSVLSGVRGRGRAGAAGGDQPVGQQCSRRVGRVGLV